MPDNTKVNPDISDQHNQLHADKYMFLLISRYLKKFNSVFN